MKIRFSKTTASIGLLLLVITTCLPRKKSEPDLESRMFGDIFVMHWQLAVRDVRTHPFILSEFLHYVELEGQSRGFLPSEGQFKCTVSPSSAEQIPIENIIQQSTPITCRYVADNIFWDLKIIGREAIIDAWGYK